MPAASPAPPPPAPDIRAWGRGTLAGIVDGPSFFSRVLVLAAALPGHLRRLRLTTTVHHLRETGLSAIPIVSSR
jgi:hypothetical protein